MKATLGVVLRSGVQVSIGCELGQSELEQQYENARKHDTTLRVKDAKGGIVIFDTKEIVLFSVQNATEQEVAQQQRESVAPRSRIITPGRPM